MILGLISAASTSGVTSDDPVKVDQDDDKFFLDYGQLYQETLAGKHWAYYLLAGSVMLTSFYMMYVIADKHLTWTLEHLSQYCRMSPDMAGMTFLAFGNGAPDFFTAFSASDEPRIVLSTSVASGLFLLSVVVGLVILVAKPKESFLNVGPVQMEKSMEEGSFKGSSELRTPEGLIPVLSPASKRILNQPKVTPTPYIRNGVLYGVCIAFLWLFAWKKVVPLWQACLLLAIYFGYMSSVVGIHYYQEHQAKKAAKRLRRATNEPKEMEAIRDNQAMKNREEEAFQELEDLPLIHRIPAAIIRVCWTFAERTGVTGLDVALLIIKLPVDLVYNLTVPPMESIEDASTCPPHMAAVRLVHRIRAILCPWGFMFLASILLSPEEHLFTLPWIVGYLTSSTLISFYMFMTTSNRTDPKAYLLHVIIAFVVSVLWIYALANELVSCLKSTGTFAGLPETLLGVVLAWGNSFGDLVSNVALAKNGHFDTAISASFCGPVQNVLLTLGASFAIAAWQNRNNTGTMVHIEGLDKDIYGSLALLSGVFGLLMIVVPLVGRFRVPRWLGWTLLGIYVTYLPLSIFRGMGFFK